MKGRPFSENELEYIREHKDQKFASQMADELAALFPGDNGGYRNPDSIKHMLKRLTEQKDTEAEGAITLEL